MDIETLRAWWSYRQGLDGRFRGAKAAQILAETGWSRSVGGVGPYLTLFSRGDVSRALADADVEAVEICELPSARGCTYVLPAQDFALGLTAGEPYRDVEMKTAKKLGVTDEEMDRLCVAVLDSLKGGALAPDEIRAATGDASRSLGEEGKKKGVTTTLPPALGNLQALGEIRRIPVEGRLDRQRYKYALWQPNPRSGFALSAEETKTELARRYFSWIGVSTLEDFQTFSALGVGASKAAVAPLNLEPIEPGSSLLIAPKDREEFAAFKRPTEPEYVLVSSLDGISLLHREVSNIVATEDADRKVYAEKAMVSLGGLGWLPANAILDRGRLVGLWEYDPEAASIVSYSFIPRNQDLASAIAVTEGYVRDQLGDARSFSLDSPKSRAPLLSALRAACASEG